MSIESIAAPAVSPSGVALRCFADRANLLRHRLTGLTALTLPCGFTGEELPLGMQLVAVPWAEATLVRAAGACEQMTSWRQRRPAR